MGERLQTVVHSFEVVCNLKHEKPVPHVAQGRTKVICHGDCRVGYWTLILERCGVSRFIYLLFARG